MDNKYLLSADNIIKSTETGELQLSNRVIYILEDLEKSAAEIEKQQSDFKAALLKAMIDNKLPSIKVAQYTFSQVVPSNTFVFDTDKFVEGESEELCATFMMLSESETFNTEKFKTENPDIYAKYIEKNTSISVDEKALAKTLPEIYKKYVTEVTSQKPITLRIVKSKK